MHAKLEIIVVVIMAGTAAVPKLGHILVMLVIIEIIGMAPATVRCELREVEYRRLVIGEMAFEAIQIAAVIAWIDGRVMAESRPDPVNRWIMTALASEVGDEMPLILSYGLLSVVAIGAARPGYLEIGRAVTALAGDNSMSTLQRKTGQEMIEGRVRGIETGGFGLCAAG